MTEAILAAKVTADIADFNRKFGDLHRTIEGVAKAPGATAAATSSAADSIEQSTGRWKSAFVAVGTAVGAAALFAVDKIGEWTQATAAAAEKVEQISQQTGIAQTTLEGWSVALARTGGDAAQFAQAFTALSKDIETARGAADFSKTKFAEMGLSLKDLGSTETVIRAVADRIATMKDPAERARLATDLLGKAGLALIPAFAQGSAGLDAAAQKAMQFGLVLDESSRTHLLQYDDALDDLGKAWQGLTTKVGAAAAPILLKGVQLAESSIVMAGKIIDAIVRMVNGVGQAFARLGQIFTNVRAKTVEVAEYFREMYDKVVGHSYVPDMVNEIGAHMKNLDVAMTAPARQATVATAKILEGLTFTAADAMNQVVSTINFAWGSATQGVSQALAQMTSKHVEWAQVGIQIGQQFLAAMINQIISLMTQWALATVFGKTQNAAQIAAHTAMEGAKTTATAVGEAARLGIALATNKAIMAGTISTLGAIAAVGMAASAVLAAIVVATSSTLAAIGSALVGTVVGAPLGAAFLAASGVVLAAGIPAALASAAAIQGAVGTAIVAATSALAIPAFAKGGAVFGPTLALVGENASRGNPEYIGHANQLGLGGIRQQTISVSIDGDELIRYTANKLIPYLRLKGAPI